MEFTRREAMITALLPFLHMTRAGAAKNTQAPAPPLFLQDLPNLTMEGWQVTASDITLAPGAAGRPHRHPGFVLVYILEGEISVRISGRPDITYTAGQMFYEEPGATHEANRNISASKPARFLALIFAKKGEPLTTPV